MTTKTHHPPRPAMDTHGLAIGDTVRMTERWIVSSNETIRPLLRSQRGRIARFDWDYLDGAWYLFADVNWQPEQRLSGLMWIENIERTDV